MSAPISIRRATTRDLPQLAKLFDLYRRFYDRESDLIGAERFLSDRLGNGESIIFVADSSQKELLGFTQLYPSFSSLGMARSWILNDLYIIESARRLGAGRLLMKAADAFAMSTGARSINLETHIDNRTAQSLYESLGYEAESEFRIYSKTVEESS